MLFLSKRNNGYYYIYYLNEFEKRASISTRCKKKNEALKYLSDFKNQLILRKEKKVIPIALNKLFFEYLNYSEAVHSKNTLLTNKSAVNSFSKYFGNVMLCDLSQKRVSDYIQFRLKNRSPRLAQKMLAILSSIFNWAISKGYLYENFASGIKTPKPPQKQPIFFSEMDFLILLRTIDNSDIRDLVEFAVYSGLRQGELLNLTWEQIDFKNQLLTLDNRTHITKTKKVRAIPLGIKVLQILTRRQMKSKSELVFTKDGLSIRQNYISIKFKSYVLKANLNSKLHFHSLRHTFASWLVQRGVSIYEVSKLLGHSDIKVTEIYSHLRAEDLRESVNLLNN